MSYGGYPNGGGSYGGGSYGGGAGGGSYGGSRGGGGGEASLRSYLEVLMSQALTVVVVTAVVLEGMAVAPEGTEAALAGMVNQETE